LVFTTKYRRGARTDPVPTRCQEIMAAGCQDLGAELRACNGDTDHVRLLVHHPPTVALSRLVNSRKGVSARYLRQEFQAHLARYPWGDHLWSPSSFAGSCKGAPLAVVKEYIERQQRPE
jgi:putative transposase